VAHNDTVIVYDDRGVEHDGAAAWRAAAREVAALDATSSHDSVVAALIAFGEFESAAADALCPGGDRFDPTLQSLRMISEALGMATAASWAGDAAAARRAARLAAASCDRLEGYCWPRLRMTTPEGYAFYAVYPEAYVDAAVAWADASRPARVVCLGLRSIGTSLSAAVAGAIALRRVPVRSWTLRPFGHPFDRHVALSRELESALELDESAVLIVDEGPGLSGSSMAGAADALSSRGIPDDRLLLMPSHPPSPERFLSTSAAARWRRHRLIVPGFDQVRARLAGAGALPSEADEISAGAWRSWFGLAAPWPAAHPQHERRKYVSRSTARVARFAGLGGAGRDVAAVAWQLGDAGLAPEPVRCAGGFLTMRTIDARPMTAGDASEAFLRHAAAYIAWRRARLSTGAAARPDTLVRMLRVNTREALGDRWMAAAELLCDDAAGFAEPAVAIDGRVQPHEWLAGATGWIKTDAWDHHRDHFLPGCTDPAWDVAGLLVEFEPAARLDGIVIGEYVRQSRDRTIAQRLPFYRAAYCAFRTGYAALASETLAGTADGRRFDALGRRYRRALRASLAGLRRPAPSGR
jgi:hypothetical protein